MGFLDDFLEGMLAPKPVSELTVAELRKEYIHYRTTPPKKKEPLGRRSQVRARWKKLVADGAVKDVAVKPYVPPVTPPRRKRARKS